jgi:hypothetical protein
MERLIMRKLALTLLLGASLPAFASVEADIKSGLSAASIIEAATAGCEGPTCADQVIADLIAAGVTLDVVISAAVKSGLSEAQAVANVTTIAVKTGKTVAAVMKAAQKAGVSDSVVIQGVSAAGVDSVTLNKAAKQNKIAAADITIGQANALATGAGTGTGNNNNPVVVDTTTTIVVNSDISGS